MEVASGYLPIYSYLAPMTPSLKQYQKSNSFVELRQETPNRALVMRRVGELASRLDALELGEHERGVLRRACRDLLQPAPADGEPFVLQDFVVEEMVRLEERELPRYLFYRYRYEVFPRTKELDAFPPCLQVEPSSACNYRCVFCYQTDEKLTDPKQGHMGVMSLDLFKRVIDEAQGKCEAITLASRGEPLMNRQIVEMLRYMEAKFLASKINTNASMLDERKCHAILEAGINTVVFSADAAAEPLYSQLRVLGNLDKVLANIRRFRDIRERHYPGSRTITRVSGVKFREDQSLDEMEALWGDLVDEVAFVAYNPWENTYDQPVNDIGTPCSDLWRRMFVWVDGRVNPCDVDYRSTLAVGDAQGRSLAELWRGEAYEALRAAHLERRRSGVSPCNRCTVV